MRVAALTGGVSAAVVAAVLGGCSIRADGRALGTRDSPRENPLLSRVDEGVDKILLSGQGIIRSSRAIGTFALNSVDYRLSTLQENLRRRRIRRQQGDTGQAPLPPKSEQLEKLHRRSANRILWLCETNRGIYIKAGQFVATLHQLPREYRSTLSVLQDQAKGRPFKVIDKVFRAEFGKSSKELFLEFEETPIAAASLAQVHRAKLHNGQEVAVKVQYPGLERQVETDIHTMAILSKAVGWFFPDYQFNWMVPQFENNLGQQLDFVREGKNAQETAINFHHKPEVKVPRIHWDLTTRRVLTMDFMRGCKIDDVDSIKAQGLSPVKVASLLVEVFAEMVFCHGHLHGDPHPGNVLIRRSDHTYPSGRDFELVLLDHGLYRDLDETFRLDFCKLWRALILCDDRGVERMGRVLGAGQYSCFLPALFTNRPIGTSHWGHQMSKEEARKLRKKVKLTDLSVVVENLPDDLFLVLRTDNLIRQHLEKLGAPLKIRLVINGKFAVQGLSWQSPLSHGTMPGALFRQVKAQMDYANLLTRIHLWELLSSLRVAFKRLQKQLTDLERELWSWLMWMLQGNLTPSLK